MMSGSEFAQLSGGYYWRWAVIGAGSVVTKNVGPQEIQAGDPARFIRKRYGDEIIKKMLEIKWWEMSDNELQKLGATFPAVKEFLKKQKNVERKCEMQADITAIILTKNEEINIGDCIKSIKDTVKRIVVIDSYSTDCTVEIARELGAEVYQHTFENYAWQYMYGVEIAKADTIWTLRIDADERLTGESAQELKDLCNKNMESDIAGIVLRFKKNFLGKDLYHGGVYPWKKMNCYKTKLGTIEDRKMDEHIVLSSGSVIEMKTDCLHFDFKNLEYFVNKHNWYSSRETVDYFEHLEKLESTDKLDVKTWIKMNIYYRLPIGTRAHLYYIYRYYFKMGFLDGKEGKIYAFLQAYWYRYLVDAKIYECQQMRTRYSGKGELRQ